MALVPKRFGLHRGLQHWSLKLQAAVEHDAEGVLRSRAAQARETFKASENCGVPVGGRPLSGASTEAEAPARSPAQAVAKRLVRSPIPARPLSPRQAARAKMLVAATSITHSAVDDVGDNCAEHQSSRNPQSRRSTPIAALSR